MIGAAPRIQAEASSFGESGPVRFDSHPGKTTVFWYNGKVLALSNICHIHGPFAKSTETVLDPTLRQGSNQPTLL